MHIAILILMALTPDKISKFWKELKRRRVVHVTIIYASAAVLIIDLASNVNDPLHLPEWVPTLIIILLAAGFPVALIFSWIFDVTPEGIERTKPAGKGEKRNKTTDPGKAGTVSSRTVPRGWKIATYISMLVIAGLVIYHISASTKRHRVNDALAKSIAILPVRNLGGDPQQDPMCAGLTSEIISQLAKIKSFDKVVPFQSVMHIDADKDVLEIAEELGVNYILETNYLKVGDEFRVNFFLIEPREDKTIWQDDYERKYEQIISIHAEIAMEIAGKLNTFISDEERGRIDKVPTQNLEAYELIQSVLYQFFQIQNRGYAYKDSIQKAIELDPGYADAWALMATFSVFQSTGLVIPGFDELDAYDYNQKALSLDPENLSALLVQAIIESWWNWNYIAADAYYQKAFTIAPNTTHQYLIISYIEFLLKMKRYEEIPPYFSRLSQPDVWGMEVYALLGMQEKAETAAKKMIEEGTNASLSSVVVYRVWERNYEQAKALVDQYSLERMVDQNGPIAYAYLAIVYYMTGDTTGAQNLMEELKTRGDFAKRGMPEFNLARYYSTIGEIDTAFVYLYQAYNEKCVDMMWLKVDPLFDNLREDERYWDLYAKTGHKAYDEYRASRHNASN